MIVNYHDTRTLEKIKNFAAVIYHEKLLKEFYNISPWELKLALIFELPFPGLPPEH